MLRSSAADHPLDGLPQWQASYGTPVAERMHAPGQPMVKVEPCDSPAIALSFGSAAASGLTKPSTGRFCLWASSSFGLAKTPTSGACIPLSSLRSSAGSGLVQLGL